MQCSRHTMSFLEDKNSDALFCQKYQDDLAMFELSSSSSIREEKQSIYVGSNLSVNASNYNNYGDDDGDCDCDDDSDSDVIVIDTTATILAEKISAEYDCVRPVQECPKPTERRRQRNGGTTKSTIAKATINTASTGYKKQDRSIPLDKQNNNCFAAELKLKPCYDNVFEGCNSFEPIEINDDSEDDGDCNFEDGKSNCGMAVKKGTSAFEISNRRIATESTTNVAKSTMPPAKTGGKRNRSMFGKNEEKESHRNEMKKVDAVNPNTLEKYSNVRRDGKHFTMSPSSACAIGSKTDIGSSGAVNFPASNYTIDSVIDVDASNDNIVVSMEIEKGQNVDKSVGINDDTTLSQLTFEVINLMDEDDECTNPPEKIVLSSNRESHQKIHGQQSKHCENDNSDNCSTQTNQLVDTARANPDTPGNISDRRNFFHPSKENSLSTPAGDVTKQFKGVSKVHFHKKIPLSELEKGAQTKQIENTLGGVPLRHQVEIIDIDEIEHIEFEVENDTDFKHEGGVDSKAKRTKTRMHTKPRFKPNKNKRLRRNEKESNTIIEEKIYSSAKNGGGLSDKSYSTFKSSYPHSVSCLNNEDHIPKSAVPNWSSCDDFAKNNGDRSRKVRPDLHSKRYVSSSPENRFIFHPSNGKPHDHHSNNFLGMNIEDARKEQERLLQQSAARVRNQPVFHVTTEPNRLRNAVRSITFSTLVRDVHQQYPDHFKYRDFFARLGLPRHANESMIKSQYRRLARVYHPDRNFGKPDTRHKFQAVTEAYNHFMNA